MCITTSRVGWVTCGVIMLRVCEPVFPNLPYLYTWPLQKNGPIRILYCLKCCGGGCGGGGGVGIGRYVLHVTNGVLVSESVWNVVCFIVANLGRDSNIHVWKGVHVYLEHILFVCFCLESGRDPGLFPRSTPRIHIA